MNSFLLELGTEEIPASMIGPALDQIRRGSLTLLQLSEIQFGTLEVFDSPRRLALLIRGLPEHQPTRRETVLGPPQRVAVDSEGRWTRAAEGFAAKNGIAVDQLELLETERGQYLGFQREEAGQTVSRLLAAEFPLLLAGLDWPKSMYWQPSKFRFIRPIRWLVALWNDQVLELEVAGIRAGRTSRGHRYLGSPQVPIPSPDRYLDVLRSEYVLVDLAERRAKIQQELSALVEADNSNVLEDPDLLLQVERLNEFPQVLRGSFEERFLEIPREILITVMRHHQKYFAVVDRAGDLKAAFLTVINTARESPMVRRGHERVLRARLEDAAFFWDKDRQVPLEGRVESLEQVVFQKDLGSYREKSRRIVQLCARLSDDPELERAAHLCKADLTTEMVFELPELQGIMGGLYARDSGQGEGVWRAIYEHYQPTSMEDGIPESRNGALLSLADKLDTLVGCFAVGIVPTGSSDAFALRRQAQGIIRILLEKNFDFPLTGLLGWAQEGLSQAPDPRVLESLLGFLEQRIRHILGESGIPYDVLNAVVATGFDNVPATAARARALVGMRQDADFEALAVAFKRIRNILIKSGQPGTETDPSLFGEADENALWSHLERIAPEVDQMTRVSDYAGALRRISTLRGPVDAFFDSVLVMDPDPGLRLNRLALLSQISKLFLTIADISEIVRKD